MISISKTRVSGFEAAIRGMRNPLESWERSDSANRVWFDDEHGNSLDYYVGPNDLALMKRLAKGGDDHGKFARFIHVSADIKAPMYWWPEYDSYKVGTTSNSCSKMHKLLAKPFEMNDFSFDHLPGYKNEIKQFRPEIDEETEEWIKFDNNYELSNQGRIRHGKRILSGSLHQDGYIFVTLYGHQYPLHRLIAKKWCDNYIAGKEVNHKDGNKQNNFASNLEWVTSSENQLHAIRNHLQPIGLTGYTGKFSPSEREQIKKEYDSGAISKRELARKYGVSHSCICSIINDKYKYANKVNIFEEVARPIVDTLNELRDSWIECDDENDKRVIWYSILQLLPDSYNQLRTVDLNYQVLWKMYRARKDHKLDEWHVFCDWVKTLPYFCEIYGI